MFNSIILTMGEEGSDAYLLSDTASGQNVVVAKEGEGVYTMSTGTPKSVGTFTMQDIGKYNTKFRKVVYTGEALSPAFDAAVTEAINNKLEQIEFEGGIYLIQSGANAKEYSILGTGESAMRYTGADLGEEFAAETARNVMAGISTFL